MFPDAPLTVWLYATSLMAAVALGLYAVGARRASRAHQFLDVRTPESVRQVSLERSGTERFLTAAPDYLREFVRNLTPTSAIEAIDNRIARAGMNSRWTADRWIAFKALLSIVVFLIVFLWSISAQSPIILLFAVALAVLVFILPDVWLSTRATNRDREIQRDLADVVDQILISVEAGASLDTAIRRVAGGADGPLQQEFARMIQDVGLGMARKDALMAMADRSMVSDLRELLISLAQSEDHGLSIGRILRVQASEIRERRRLYAEEEALKIPVKLVFPLVLCILPCLLAVIMGPAIVRISQSFF